MVSAWWDVVLLGELFAYGFNLGHKMIDLRLLALDFQGFEDQLHLFLGGAFYVIHLGTLTSLPSAVFITVSCLSSLCGGAPVERYVGGAGLVGRDFDVYFYQDRVFYEHILGHVHAGEEGIEEGVNRANGQGDNGRLVGFGDGGGVGDFQVRPGAAHAIGQHDDGTEQAGPVDH